MVKVIFKTPTTLDLNAITVFGLSAKPSSLNPIGYFGTGLKYAIAILAREQCNVKIYIGLKEFKLNVKDAGFRGKVFQALELISDDEKIQLPFTTELGKNWELWQAFREVYCNTIDESGDISIDDSIKPAEGQTIIAVESDEFLDIFEDRYNQVFLENADTFTTSGVQIINKPSDYIYYRGIRVFKTSKPCLNTYNILSPVTLTEDRTAAYEFSIRENIVNALKLEKNIDVLENALNCGENYYESGLDYCIYSHKEISEDFKKVGLNCENQKLKSIIYKTSDEYKKREKEEKDNDKQEHFCYILIQLLQKGLEIDFAKVAKDNKDELIEILESHLENEF